MTKNVLRLLFLALISCEGSSVKNSNPSSIVSDECPPSEITVVPNSSHAQKHGSTRYCVFLTYHKKNGSIEKHLLTDSGEITEEQLKKSFRGIDSVWEAIATVLGMVSTMRTFFEESSFWKPIFKKGAIVVTPIAAMYILYDRHTGVKRTKMLISEKYDKITDKDMDEAVKRIRSEKSSRPGSCDHYRR